MENVIWPLRVESAVIVSLNKGKEEKTECRNYRGISLLVRLEKYMQGF